MKREGRGRSGCRFIENRDERQDEKKERKKRGARECEQVGD